MNASQQNVVEREQRILRTCWSLGWVTTEAIGVLAAPDVGLGFLRVKVLPVLVARGELVRVLLHLGRQGSIALHGLGRKADAINPELKSRWRPPVQHAAHTVGVCRTLARLHERGHVLGWRGEVALHRDRVVPRPDVWVRTPSAGWFVEYDRATEDWLVLQRKLRRYVALDVLAPNDVVVFVTTTTDRAYAMAQLAARNGVHCLAVAEFELNLLDDPLVFDTWSGIRRPLSASRGPLDLPA